MRYCTFVIEGIFKHDYYKAPRYAQQRTLTNKRIQSVLTKLELVSDWMDVEEIEKEKQRRAMIERQREEQLRKQRMIEQQRFEELQRRVEQQKLASSVASLENVQESALAKLQRLSQPSGQPAAVAIAPPPQQQQQQPAKRVSFHFPPVDQEEAESRSEANGYSIRLDDSDSLPPPMLPPGQGDDTEASIAPAPPSYQQILANSKLIANHSYFGPGKAAVTEPTLPPYDQLKPTILKPPPPTKLKRINVRQLKAEARQRYIQHQQQGSIQVTALGTYQGRVGSSTNGCTVISALVASKHLETHGGVTNDQITSVIDRECGPLLRQIRSKLQLSESSLIIPSDVHDHLVDCKILFQHKFVGASGGNIIDPAHLKQVLDLLQGETDQARPLKSAATLFFHEHVVSIVKYPTSPTDAVYDLIDSLPGITTSMGGSRGTRTRCSNLETLQVLLEWYATQKFSESNCTYIDRNPTWDDTMADFDPRVFQAFVWADLPKPTPSATK